MDKMLNQYYNKKQHGCWSNMKCELRLKDKEKYTTADWS